MKSFKQPTVGVLSVLGTILMCTSAGAADKPGLCSLNSTPTGKAVAKKIAEQQNPRITPTGQMGGLPTRGVQAQGGIARITCVNSIDDGTGEDSIGVVPGVNDFAWVNAMDFNPACNQI